MDKIAPGLGSYLIAAIDQNRWRSCVPTAAILPKFG